MAGKTHRVGQSIIETTEAFGTVGACVSYLEAARWPEGIKCLQCGGSRISKFVTSETSRNITNRNGESKTVAVPARQLYQCLETTCKFQFSVTTGTIFNDTHLPLNKWFLAVALMTNARKGISAKQMERHLDVSYKTAWYLCHRIRRAMSETGGVLFTGVIEADETYVGRKYDKRRKRAKYDKAPVFGVIERGGRVRAAHLEQANRHQVFQEIKSTVAPEAKIMTDESSPSSAFRSMVTTTT